MVSSVVHELLNIIINFDCGAIYFSRYTTKHANAAPSRRISPSH